MSKKQQKHDIEAHILYYGRVCPCIKNIVLARRSIRMLVAVAVATGDLIVFHLLIE